VILVMIVTTADAAFRLMSYILVAIKRTDVWQAELKRITRHRSGLLVDFARSFVKGLACLIVESDLWGAGLWESLCLYLLYLSITFQHIHASTNHEVS